MNEHQPYVRHVTAKLTPLHLQIFIHAHAFAEPFPHKDGSISIEYENELLKRCLIEWDDDYKCFKTTALGRAHVAQIMALPLPRQAWIDQTGKVIDLN